MKEGAPSAGGGSGDGSFVRADQIDLKSLDEQLERHLSRAWTTEKKKEEPPARRRREDWEIDPAKLVVRGVIARGTFGTVHRGIYDGQDVAGTCLPPVSPPVCATPFRPANASQVAVVRGPEAPLLANRGSRYPCFFLFFPLGSSPVISVG
jgi:hypothetical protein